ncbi:MAG: nitrogenase, partial [Crenarchaeota archaeon]|nr:nitrogenase [Thermoproteota archaeon]
MAFAGIEKSITLLDGSQGCSTYIRRYMISHYKEPIDIASSNFGENAVIFGGGDNFRTALENVIVQYSPEFVGVATTCLAETIGDDVGAFIKEFKKTYADQHLPVLVSVSTPSYAGTESEGFYGTVRAIVDQTAEAGDTETGRINLIPGMVSPADIRNLREVVESFGLKVAILPDYSDTLDGQTWTSYIKIAPGGTTVAELRSAGSAAATI